MSSIVVRLDISGLDLTDDSSQATQTWKEVLQALISSISKTSSNKDIYGRDLDDTNSVLLILHERSEDQVLAAIAPLNKLLTSPVQISAIPTSSIISYPDARVQQTTFYQPTDAFHPEALSTGMDMRFQRWQHRCIARDFRQGEMPGETTYQGQKCKAWVVYSVWFEHSEPLPAEEGGREGDARPLGLKSLKEMTADAKLGVVGCEERNWKFEALDTLTASLSGKWCVVM